MFTHPDFAAHEQVMFAHDRASGLRAIIALHSTVLGPAFGGCRMWPYASEAEGLADVLRLSRAMTAKAAICSLPYGGGKAVIFGDPLRDKSKELLRSLGRFVHSLGGRYIIADDIGTNLEDLAVMREVTPFTAAATLAAQQALPITACGVLAALRAAVRHHLGQEHLKGLRVAVQGLGNVGFPLCDLLFREGAELIVADLAPARLQRAVAEFEARAVPADEIYEQPAHVFAPCALGGVLNERTIPWLRAQIVCGGANNQLARAELDRVLQARGILYVPDYVANAGGVIDFHQERIDDRPQAVLDAVARIGEITADLLDRAARTGATPLEVAERTVEERLAAAQQNRNVLERGGA